MRGPKGASRLFFTAWPFLDSGDGFVRNEKATLHAFHEQFQRRVFASVEQYSSTLMQLSTRSGTESASSTREPVGLLEAPPTETPLPAEPNMLVPFSPKEKPMATSPKSKELKLELAPDSQFQLRGYEELLDEFSFHQFLIRRGRAIDITPEFASFQRKYSRMWPAIQRVIHQVSASSRNRVHQLTFVSSCKNFFCNL